MKLAISCQFYIFACSTDQLWRLFRTLSDQYYPIFRFWGPSKAVVSIRHPDDLEVFKWKRKYNDSRTKTQAHTRTNILIRTVWKIITKKTTCHQTCILSAFLLLIVFTSYVVTYMSIKINFLKHGLSEMRHEYLRLFMKLSII